MSFRTPRTVKVAVNPIFCDQGFAQIFGSSAEIFELLPEEWERICSSPDAPLRPEIMCSVRELKSGIERMIGEVQVKLYFPRYIREHQKRISERELSEIRVDSLSASRWTLDVYSSQGEAKERKTLRESLRGQRCVGASLRHEFHLTGAVTLDADCPFLNDLLSFFDFMRSSGGSMTLCLELFFESGGNFCVEVDLNDLHSSQPGLWERILAF